MTLEQLARENGVLYSDRATPCMAEILKDDELMNKSIATLLKRVTDRDNRR